MGHKLKNADIRPLLPGNHVRIRLYPGKILFRQFPLQVFDGIFGLDAHQTVCDFTRVRAAGNIIVIRFHMHLADRKGESGQAPFLIREKRIIIIRRIFRRHMHAALQCPVVPNTFPGYIGNMLRQIDMGMGIDKFPGHSILQMLLVESSVPLRIVKIIVSHGEFSFRLPS